MCMYMCNYNSLSLSLSVPSLFIVHPQSVTNYTAGQVSFTCSAYGLPVPTLVWLKNGELVSSSSDNITITETESSSNTTGYAVSVLSIINLVLDDNGAYYCTANNTGALGNIFTVSSLQATLTVQCKYNYFICTILSPPPPSFIPSLSPLFLFITDPPSLVISPVNMIVNQTDIVTITCTVFASPPPLITWTDERDNMPLSSLQDVISISETGSGNIRTSVLTFHSIVKANESNYTCMAVNNVTNIINTVEQATSSITVQGMLV